jgi:hypothetical protein
MAAASDRLAILVTLLALGCSAERADPSPPCEQECLDGVAIRSLRETIKLVYNIKLQGNPVGAQDETTPCPLGGSARVFGTASSNPLHGATEVDLTYELDACRYISVDRDPGENYDMTLTGTVTQLGTLAVQPNATMGLVIRSDAMTFSGKVYDPSKPYAEVACVVERGRAGIACPARFAGVRQGSICRPRRFSRNPRSKARGRRGCRDKSTVCERPDRALQQRPARRAWAIRRRGRCAYRSSCENGRRDSPTR